MSKAVVAISIVETPNWWERTLQWMVGLMQGTVRTSFREAGLLPPVGGALGYGRRVRIAVYHICNCHCAIAVMVIWLYSVAILHLHHIEAQNTDT